RVFVRPGEGPAGRWIAPCSVEILPWRDIASPCPATPGHALSRRACARAPTRLDVRAAAQAVSTEVMAVLRLDRQLAVLLAEPVCVLLEELRVDLGDLLPGRRLRDLDLRSAQDAPVETPAVGVEEHE